MVPGSAGGGETSVCCFDGRIWTKRKKPKQHLREMRPGFLFKLFLRLGLFIGPDKGHDINFATL